MIQNEYTNETAHVANWFLHSGQVDLDALVDEAETEVIKEASFRAMDLDDEKREDFLVEALAYEVQCIFLQAAGLDGEDIEFSGGYVGCPQESYKGAPPSWLALTLSGR